MTTSRRHMDEPGGAVTKPNGKLTRGNVILAPLQEGGPKSQPKYLESIAAEQTILKLN